MSNHAEVLKSTAKSKQARLPSLHSSGKRRIDTALAQLSAPCPVCGETTGVRPEIVLIDDALIIHLSSLSVAGDQPQYLRQLPSGPSVERNYCESCKAFVS